MALCEHCRSPLPEEVHKHSIRVRLHPQRVMIGEEPVWLTPGQARMLARLLRYGRATYEQLARDVTSHTSVDGIKSYIHRLRKVLAEHQAPVAIRNEFKEGYYIERLGDA